MRKAIGGGIGPATIELAELHAIAIEGTAGLLQLAAGGSHVRKLRPGVGAPRNHQRIGARAPREQRVTQRDARLRIGRVRELQRRAHIPCRVDVRVGGAQAGVDGNAGLAVDAHPGPRQREVLDVACTAGGDQHLIGGDRGAVRKHQHLARARARGAGDPRAEAQPHAVPDQSLSHPLRRVGFVLRQDLWPELEQLDLRAEAREGLCELAADGTRTQHRQTPRLPGEIEHALVGQGRDLRQSRQRRNVGARARGDHGAARAQRRPGDANLMRTAEAPLPEEHVDSRAAVTLDRIVPGKGRTHRAHPLHGACKAQAAGGAREQRLRGHTTDVQAVTAHGMTLDQRHSSAQSRRGDGGHQARRAGADHREVVARRGRGIAIVRGKHQPAPQRVILAHGASSCSSRRRATRVSSAATVTVAARPTTSRTVPVLPVRTPPESACARFAAADPAYTYSTVAGSMPSQEPAM